MRMYLLFGLITLDKKGSYYINLLDELINNHNLELFVRAACNLMSIWA